MQQLLIVPYFEGRINFAVSVDNTMKILYVKCISAYVIIHKITPVILENKIVKMLNLWHSQNIRHLNNRTSAAF